MSSGPLERSAVVSSWSKNLFDLKNRESSPSRTKKDVNSLATYSWKLPHEAVSVRYLAEMLVIDLVLKEISQEELEPILSKFSDLV
jgi:hypothetical protein